MVPNYTPFRLIIGSNSRVISAINKETFNFFLSSKQLHTLSADAIRVLVDESVQVIFQSYCYPPTIFNINRSTETALHLLANTTKQSRRKIVFLSTDAINLFEKKSNSPSLNKNLIAYALHKRAQEAIFADCTIIRFTTVGPSFSNDRGLLAEMILTNSISTLYPFSHFSPVSTFTLNKLLCDLIDEPLPLGLVVISSDAPISKQDAVFDLADAVGIKLKHSAFNIDFTELDLSFDKKDFVISWNDTLLEIRSHFNLN